MITVDVALMAYPIPKRYHELLRHPFRPRRRVEALRDVSLTIGPGERVALVGPNGAGKSTLLKLLAGLLYPTRGRVEVDGLDTVRSGLAVRHSVGLVINEDRSFYWRLTGAENLEFFGVLDNLSGRELRERTAQLLALVGLADAANQRVSDYSSGMRQRLAIARGLMTDPRILLLDEPTRSLDPVGAEDIRTLIAGPIQADTRRVLVVATNQLDDVTDLCDRVIVIQHGRIVQSAEVGAHRSERSISALYRDAVRTPAGSR